MSLRDYSIIDSDGHVLEPADMWPKYMEKAFLDRAPRIVLGDDGKERLHLGDTVIGGARGINMVGAIGRRDNAAGIKKDFRYADGCKGGFDPLARLKDLDVDGIDAVFLYPTLGLFSGAIADPDYARAICRAYNRWLADYCAAAPERLFGVAMLPMQSIDHAIEELRFARKELGMRAAFLRPNPYNGRMAGHPDYDPFWAVAQDLDMAIGFHEGGASGMPTVGVDRFESRGARHIVSHTMEMMLVAVSVIWGGVCERFPKLRLSFLESGGGWIAPWLDRMDRHYTDQGFNDSGLTMKPSEYFQRNCWISFEPVEGALTVLADYIGPDKILWGTDYPHVDGFFPGAPKMMVEGRGFSEATRRGILCGGARAYYKLG